MRFLLDTCVLSELVKNAPDPHVLRWFAARKAHELCISAITWGELQRGVAKLPRSKRRSELAAWLAQLDAGFEDRILAFDRGAAEVWAQMAVQAETRGKSLSTLDSLIAATAHAYDCRLVTRNVRDYAHTGIAILNPWGATPG